jgi:hypothetical protein
VDRVALVGNPQGRPFDVRGVTLFTIAQGQVVAGRLYREDVDPTARGIDEAVESLPGSRPRRP